MCAPRISRPHCLRSRRPHRPRLTRQFAASSRTSRRTFPNSATRPDRSQASTTPRPSRQSRSFKLTATSPPTVWSGPRRGTAGSSTPAESTNPTGDSKHPLPSPTTPSRSTATTPPSTPRTPSSGGRHGGADHVEPVERRQGRRDLQVPGPGRTRIRFLAVKDQARSGGLDQDPPPGTYRAPPIAAVPDVCVGPSGWVCPPMLNGSTRHRTHRCPPGARSHPHHQQPVASSCARWLAVVGRVRILFDGRWTGCPDGSRLGTTRRVTARTGARAT